MSESYRHTRTSIIQKKIRNEKCLYALAACGVIICGLLICISISGSFVDDITYVYYNEETETIQVSKSCISDSDYNYCQYKEEKIVVEDVIQLSDEQKAIAIKKKIERDAKKEDVSAYEVFMKEIKNSKEKRG